MRIVPCVIERIAIYAKIKLDMRYNNLKSMSIQERNGGEILLLLFSILFFL